MLRTQNAAFFIRVHQPRFKKVYFAANGSHQCLYPYIYYFIKKVGVVGRLVYLPVNLTIFKIRGWCIGWCIHQLYATNIYKNFA